MKQALNTAMALALARVGLASAPACETAEHTPTCQYCNNPAELVTGKEIYPTYTNLHAKKFWRCLHCAAYVGCHEADKGYGDGTRPLGLLANSELRAAKMAVHESFDMIWQDGAMPRRKAYQWLADQLGIKFEDCHIGMFSLDMCQRAEAICDAFEYPAELI